MKVLCWAQYYYKSYLGQEYTTLSTKLLAYTSESKYWCSGSMISRHFLKQSQSVILDEQAMDEKDQDLHRKLIFDVVTYWRSCAGYCPELAKLALPIFRIVISSAAVERLFSDMGFIKSDRRNRLGWKKLLGIVRFRDRLKYEERERNKRSSSCTKRSKRIAKFRLARVSFNPW